MDSKGSGVFLSLPLPVRFLFMLKFFLCKTNAMLINLNVHLFLDLDSSFGC